MAITRRELTAVVRRSADVFPAEALAPRTTGSWYYGAGSTAAVASTVEPTSLRPGSQQPIAAPLGGTTGGTFLRSGGENAPGLGGGRRPVELPLDESPFDWLVVEAVTVPSAIGGLESGACTAVEVFGQNFRPGDVVRALIDGEEDVDVYVDTVIWCEPTGATPNGLPFLKVSVCVALPVATGTMIDIEVCRTEARLTCDTLEDALPVVPKVLGLLAMRFAGTHILQVLEGGIGGSDGQFAFQEFEQVWGTGELGIPSFPSTSRRHFHVVTTPEAVKAGVSAGTVIYSQTRETARYSSIDPVPATRQGGTIVVADWQASALEILEVTRVPSGGTQKWNITTPMLGSDGKLYWIQYLPQDGVGGRECYLQRAAVDDLAGSLESSVVAVLAGVPDDFWITPAGTALFTLGKESLAQERVRPTDYGEWPWGSTPTLYPGAFLGNTVPATYAQIRTTPILDTSVSPRIAVRMTATGGGPAQTWGITWDPIMHELRENVVSTGPVSQQIFQGRDLLDGLNTIQAGNGAAFEALFHAQWSDASETALLCGAWKVVAGANAAELVVPLSGVPEGNLTLPRLPGGGGVGALIDNIQLYAKA